MQARKTDRSLDAYLKSAKDLARLSAHADRLLTLQQIYAQIAPNYLAEASQVANYKSGIVVIHAASGAVAVKLMQLGRSLRDEFCKRGCEVTEVTAKVQPLRAKEGPVTAAAVRELPAAGAGKVSDLARQLPVDSPLRQALQRLLDHARHGR